MKRGKVDYLYDLAGNAVTELNASGNWTRKEIYAGSRHVATYKDGPTGTTYFSHTDWLGTERVRTDKAGTTVESCTSLPFGDAQTCTGTSVSPIHFTGKQRDTESDNDYFDARYYISRHGRWLTPDWSSRQEAVPYASLGNPQTLNLYAYVGNNPVSTADADGHGWAFRGRGGEGIVMFFGIGGMVDISVPGLPEGGELESWFYPAALQRALANNGTQTQQQQPPQQQIADTAQKYVGSSAWAYTAQKGAFACNTNKCNAFVGDVTKEAGAPVSVTGSDGKARYPLASELADKNTKIANWRVLGPNEKPQPGDIGAYKLSGGGTSFSGHSGIVTAVDQNGTVHAVAAHATVVGPDNKFDRSVTPTVVYRRFTGGQ